MMHLFQEISLLGRKQMKLQRLKPLGQPKLFESLREQCRLTLFLSSYWKVTASSHSLRPILNSVFGDLTSKA